MTRMPLNKALPILLAALIVARSNVLGQMEVRGTVYDRSRYFALPGVSVLSTSGLGTMTDSTGQYHLRVTRKDSISFSYLGRSTAKFPIRNISVNSPMDISLAVAVDSLPLVVVRPKPYRYDSMANRDEYRKIFDYEPDYVGQGEGGAGINLDMLFGARRNRQMLALKTRLIEEEQEKYVDYRFNRTLVRQITGLDRPALELFMHMYRPTYDFVKSCENEYEFYKYIKDCGIYFMRTYKIDTPPTVP
jgi:carboxypeptidase-like protein